MNTRARTLSRVTAALLVLAATPLLAQPAWNGADVWHDGWGWGHMAFGAVLMLLFWGAVVLAIVMAVRWLAGPAQQRPEAPASANRALAILEERFARGEIDQQEFEERKRALSS